MELFASQERALEMLFFGDPSKAFQGQRQELVRHAQKTVREGEKNFVEHHFVTKVVGNEQPMETVLRIDSDSKLPVSWESKIGKTLVFACKVDFPVRGPQTIYAMGVPQDAQVLDQTPSDDLKQILAAWNAGRTRFDSYRAVVVESSSADHRASGRDVYQVWRKGLKWRVDQLRMPPRLGPGPFADEVPAGVDPTAWWLQRGATWEPIPRTVSDGAVEIRLEPIYAEPRQPDPNNPRYGLIKHLQPHRTSAFSIAAGDPRPAYDDRIMPEFHAYPFLHGLENWGYQTTVHPHPASGPEGTMLIESLRKNPPKASGRIRGARYWADPARNHLVKQVQWLKTGEPENTSKGVVEMGELALSPSGLWYPRLVREVQNSVNLDDGTTGDTYLRFYVDFEAEIPDDLFDVQLWGPTK
jgi:hypothetical protein